jgi:cytochrome bd ubiquinol oxidase subunit II
MVDYFRQRAVVVAVVAGVVALVGIFVLRADARYVFDGLTARAVPLVLLSVVCGIGSLVLLLRRSARGARPLAAGAVASIVWAWGVAQWPYILPTSLTVSAAAAPSATLGTLLVVFGVAAVVILPSLALLYVLDQRTLLPEEGLDSRPAAGASTPAS